MRERATMTSTFRTMTAAFLMAAALSVTTPPSATAQALSLDTAKAQGLVGERRNGYLGVVKNTAGVQALVDRINLKRRQHYMGIARQNGTNLQAVEAIVGQKVLQRAQSGTIVEGDGGSWVKKP